MQYKTTYFHLSINNECFIFDENYKQRINGFKWKIKTIEETLIRLHPNIFANKSVAELSIPELTVIKTELPANDYLKELIEIKKDEQTFLNKRYTEVDNVLFQEHINEVGNDGWKLVSFQPILKGIYGRANDAGYGFSITEGFVIMWEKM
jgi:hypothetical protein